MKEPRKYLLENYVVILLFVLFFLKPVLAISQTIDSSGIKIEEKNNLHFGFRLEHNSVIEKTLLNYESQPEYVSRFHIYGGYIFSPISLYFQMKYNYSSETDLEVRTGVLMAGDLLSGIMLGVNAYYFPGSKDIYFVSGFEIIKHSKIMEFISEQSHYIPNPKAARSVYWNNFFVAYSVGAGYCLSEDIAVDVTVLKMLNEEYGCYIINEETGRYKLPNGKYDLDLQWMFKLGINIYFQP